MCQKKKTVIENFGIGDLFNFGGKKEKEVIDLRPAKSEKNPSTFSTLNYKQSLSDDPNSFDNELDFDSVNNIGLSESEKAIDDKFSKKLPLLPNYTKNPESELARTLNKLKGDGDVSKFKKDVDIPIQKFQSKGPDSKEKTVPDSILDKHKDDIDSIVSLGASLGVKNNVKSAVSGKGMEQKGSNGMKCKFLNSSKCHPDYPNFSGASISFPEGAKMKCDSVGNETMPKAVCTIHKGRINGVYLINKGSGLIDPPKVDAVGGGGRNATLKAIVKNGEVEEIKVINPGEGFHETPDITFESNNISSGCYLCCK